MKNLFALTCLATALFSTTAAVQAQSQTSDILAPPTEKNIYLNAGFGIGAYTAGGIPVGISAEVDVFKNISVGGFLDYARYSYKYAGYKWNYNFLYIGARGSYHLSEALEDLEINNPKLDPYVGLSLGVRRAWYNDNDGEDDFVSPYSGGVFAGVHLGTRYMITDNVGAFAEVGYGVSALKLGVTAKF